MSGLIPVAGQVVVQVTPPSTPAVTLNQITVGGINQPSVAYHHTQGTSSAVWTITHNLGWYPNVTVQDSGGSIVEGEIAYTSTMSLTITFTGAFSGRAYLS
jgi:hypothetical protein